MNPVWIALALALPVAGWRLYVRLRQASGRQRLVARRLWSSLSVLTTLVLALSLIARHQTEALLGLAGGLCLGGLLAFLALRITVFESTSEGLFYKPSAHIGTVLALALIARFVYRIAELRELDPATSDPARLLSPLTLAVAGTVAGYYIAYAAGLLHWQRAAQPPVA